MKQPIIIAVVISFLSNFLYMPIAQAQSFKTESYNYAEDEIFKTRISEYFYGYVPKQVLKPIKVLGSVQKPGLYHVPDGTSLTTLLSVSGGVTREAKVDSITVSRKDGTQIKGELKDFINPRKDIQMLDGDTLYIPKDEGIFAESTGNTLTILASFITVLLTGYLVVDSKK
jgi:hypothetical protein